MTNDTSPRLLPWNAASTWIAAVATVVFFGLGMRAFLDPAGASSFFGIPVTDPSGLAFVQVYGARNMGLSLVALALLVLDVRRGVAAVFLAAALIAGLDFTVVATQSGALRAAKHLGYFFGLSGFGFWLSRRP